VVDLKIRCFTYSSIFRDSFATRVCFSTKHHPWRFTTTWSSVWRGRSFTVTSSSDSWCRYTQ